MIDCKVSMAGNPRNHCDLFPYHGGKSDRATGNVKLLVRKAGARELQPVKSMIDGRLVEESEYVPSGEIITTVQGDNLILDRSRTLMSNLYIGDNVTTRYINRMSFGTGGHAPGDTTTPVTPAVGDSQLESQVLIKNLSTSNYPSTTSVTIIAFILENEGNGFTITESGLVAVDNTLAARRTFAGQAKTDEFVFEFQWTIQF